MSGIVSIWFAAWTAIAQWRQRRLGKRLNLWAARGIRWNFKSRRKT